jgi:hypothetical protein
MSDLKIIIKSSAKIKALAKLSDVSSKLIYLNIPAENVASANELLSKIDSEEWTVSNAVTDRSMDNTDSLVLPKKAVK